MTRVCVGHPSSLASHSPTAKAHGQAWSVVCALLTVQPGCFWFWLTLLGGTWWWWLFSSCARILGKCLTIIPHLRFFLFFKVEISLRRLIPLFRPWSVHSGSASWDDCDWVLPDKLCVSLFSDRFPHSAWTAALSAQSDFDGSRV